jgi:hypothetical protein
MTFLKQKKGIAALAAVAVVAIGAFGAYAYWTTSGSGTGTGAVASGNGTVTLHGSAPTNLVPGGSSSVTFTADNAGTSDLYVGTITLAGVDAFTDSGFTSAIPVGTGATQCDVSKFTMAPVLSSTTVTAGAVNQGVAGTGTLAFANDAGNNQDGCKNAVLRLNLTSN